MKEAALQSKIIKALKAHGGWWRKFHQGMYAGQGNLDIVGCYKGLFIAMEVKRPDVSPKEQEPTPLQAKTIKEIRQDGEGISLVVKSEEGALLVLKAVDKHLAKRRVRDT